MIAAMDEQGFVTMACIANLAKRANVTMQEAEEAVVVLESPDTKQPDQENEGRRIERVHGGWMVLNSEKYRSMVTRAESLQKNRERVARFRAKKNGNAPVMPCNVSVMQSEQSRADTKTRAAGAAPAADSEWISELSQNPAYQGIDVNREFQKMMAWTTTNARQPTRRRFVNWLNRVERPISLNGHAAPQKPALNEPKGWKAWLNHNRPDSVYSVGGNSECHEWAKLPREAQEVVLAGLR